jgi:hypothetical protein
MNRSMQQAGPHTLNLQTRLATAETEIAERERKIADMQQPTRDDIEQLNALKIEATVLRNHIEVRSDLFAPPRDRRWPIG